MMRGIRMRKRRDIITTMENITAENITTAMENIIITPRMWN